MKCMRRRQEEYSKKLREHPERHQYRVADEPRPHWLLPPAEQRRRALARKGRGSRSMEATR